MAIIVENGTGLPNAVAYCDYAYFHNYVTMRGLQYSHSVETVEAALVVAAIDWIDGEHEFANDKLKTTQSLKFPRTVFGFPTSIKEANAHAAWLHLNKLLLPDLSLISQSGDIESESKQLSVMSKSVTYAAGTSQKYSRVLPKSLNLLLRPYLSFSGGVAIRRTIAQ